MVYGFDGYQGWQEMGLDLGIRVTLPEDSVIDVAVLAEEAAAWLAGRFGGTNGMYCLPQVYLGDERDEFFVVTQMIRWGGPLAEAGHQVGDIHRMLAAGPSTASILLRDSRLKRFANSAD